MGLDIAKMEAEKARLKNKGGTEFLANFVRMPEKQGAVPVRILPPADGHDYPWLATRTHKVNEKNIHCPKVLVGVGSKARWQGECTICAYYNYQWQQSELPNISKEESENLKAKARAIKPVERYYYNGIVREQKNENGEKELNVGPKILSVGKMMHDFIVRAITGDDELLVEKLGDITDPQTGYDLTIVKTLKKGDNGQVYPNYNESRFAKNPSILGTPEQVKTWMENLHNLDSLRVLLSPDEMKRQLKMHLGLIKSEKSGSFDPSEFQTGGDAIGEETVSRPNVSTAAVITTQEVSDDAGGEAEDDNEFIAKLKASVVK